MIEEIVELHAIAKGRVQGVGFRYKTSEYAISLGLKGTVRNVPDGSVEIYAQGRKEALESLLRYLVKQAFPSEIASIESSYSPPSKVYKEFEIIAG